jgi:hypothetical protein
MFDGCGANQESLHECGCAKQEIPSIHPQLRNCQLEMAAFVPAIHIAGQPWDSDARLAMLEVHRQWPIPKRE